MTAMQTLTRYTNRDGNREVILTTDDDPQARFTLTDAPPGAFAAPGTYFLLSSYATREDAQEAAEQHADLAAELGTYEAVAAHEILARRHDAAWRS